MPPSKLNLAGINKKDWKSRFKTTELKIKSRFKNKKFELQKMFFEFERFQKKNHSLL